MRQRKRVPAIVIVLAVFMSIFAAISMILGISIQSYESSFSERGLREIYECMEDDYILWADTTGMAYLLEQHFGLDTTELGEFSNLLREMEIDKVRYAITGKGEPVDASMITKAVIKMAEEAGVEISKDDLENFKDALVDVNEIAREWADLAVEMNEGIAECRMLVSVNLPLIFFGFSVAMFILIFVMMIGSPETAMVTVGITATVSGVLGLLIGLLCSAFETLAINEGEITAVVYEIMKKRAYAISCLLLFVGILLIYSGRKIRKARDRVKESVTITQG